MSSMHIVSKLGQSAIEHLSKLNDFEMFVNNREKTIN